jgi:hypothetical protein
MTTTMPSRQPAAYRGVVYGFDLLDHASVMADRPVVVPDDYVGKTRQRGRLREMQHRDDKPWSDLIVGFSHVLWEGICDEDELDRREVAMIRLKASRMNDRDNRWNRTRINLDEQVRQRHERDDHFGRPRWVPRAQRRRDSLLEWDTPERPVFDQTAVEPRRQWKPWQKQLVAWLFGWLITTVTGWVALVWRFDFPVWWCPPAISGSATALVMLWALAGFPHPRLRKAKKRRRKR